MHVKNMFTFSNHMEEIIDLYSNFSKENIDDFINVGVNLYLNLDKISFIKYCRNLINFLINNTKFNYLIDFLSDVNSEIIKDYEKNKVHIKYLIEINNILLVMIKNNTFDDIKFKNLSESNFVKLNNYIYYLKNINNLNYHKKLFIVGSNKVDRIYIHMLVCSEFLKKFNTNDLTYINDVFNNFFCLLLKLKEYYKENNNLKNLDDINNIINKFDRNMNINYIEKSVNKILFNMSIIPEIKTYVDSSNIKIPEYKKSNTRRNNYDTPLIIATSLTIISAIIIKIM